MKNLIQIIKNIQNRFLKYVFMVLVFLIQLACVEKEDFETFEMDGFIVGFNPCTINHQYRVGYVIISNDFSDTIATYSLSPKKFTMPAPVGLNPNRPLYTIPEHEFRYSGGSAYFPEFLYYPDSLIKNYPIKVTYRKALEHELQINRCRADFNMADFIKQWLFNQVIVVKASKN
ncbi:hypothetical protein [Mongoliitalea daihaiensis]|uniref:Uncharacterized protein n=2 Tax=Mongoliitalea lutea TaxID=849756 RepID=A0A8J3CXQ4_9BACT|nr:hypothetical protein [Mongoliitalea daihaiensis]UJP65847.1 hypothetical protein IPZ59_04270 [Mongoliitalea daihaiensis]GHB39029.1 hypothetical protein GCM10008106_20300 [Mongoliitalea lutea]